MELDKRIKNNHRPLCVIDIKWAMGFIGQNGFFADAINCFENLSECQNGKLVDAEDNKIHPFECDNEWNYMFFIPEEWVKEPEKKYRPFTLEEFLKIFDIGDQIGFRSKDNGEVKHAMFVGYIDDFFADNSDRSDGENDVMIGIYRFSLSYLFDNYELLLEDGWQPFGIEE